MGSLESDTTERLHFQFSLSCIGEGNGNPLQCSCLQIPGLTWAGIAVVALIVLVATTCVSWIVQAASMRGAAMAADKGSFTLSEALRLGRQRLVSLLKLSLTFGVLITALGLAPPLLILLVGQASPSS